MTDTETAAATSPVASPGLQMKHLEELKAEIEAARKSALDSNMQGQKAEEEGTDPRQEKLYSFDIEFKAARGQVIRGRFTNKILSIGEKISVGTMRARLQMGVSLDAMAAETYNLLFMVTWMQQSLTDKPAWAQDLLALESEGLVAAIFAKVDGHERYFRGQEADLTESETAV